ncbi:hypothetical protein [Paenibacillus macquariensis]|uniref:Uncharacterized protein n=1 Tax=Paenibacillus macquariensis TaxID=948756 RepID=A0ABY1JK65_9BACL|nr:hypothetical protein [Paenibacillus macquariensis]MEC0089871.1 hypothetical protein [Paenibacillus macquariensis]OAB30666.1 hypothetical protein PMSM_21195 [Paenibacillus macquariensis subsp. macquariensis]SIQ33120.1 hypothetical protein SAMN05421578_101253 [Paenibacillus macquariensis]
MEGFASILILEYMDDLYIIPMVLLFKNSWITQRDGTVPPKVRVEEIENFTYEWAKREGFLKHVNG